MVAPLIAAIPAAISGIAGYLGKGQEIKKTREQAQAKLRLKKETGDQNITLTDAEWESLSTQKQDSTWKDEYVTIVLTAPIIMVLIGAVWNGFDPSNDKLLTGTLRGISALRDIGLDYGLLSTAVVMAAVGLKIWRKGGQ